MARSGLLQLLARAQVPEGRRVPLCFLCRKPVNYATIEHVRPKRCARFRWDQRGNKVVTCLACNARKADREPTASEMTRLTALKRGDPDWFRIGDAPLEDSSPPPARPPHQTRISGSLRIDVPAFKAACADAREDWGSYSDYERNCWISIHTSYRSWLRSQLFDRRGDFMALPFGPTEHPTDDQ